MLAVKFTDTMYGYGHFVDAAVFATADTAVEEVTKEKETNTIYEVEVVLSERVTVQTAPKHLVV